MIETNNYYAPIENYQLEDDFLVEKMQSLSLEQPKRVSKEESRRKKEEDLQRYQQIACPWVERGVVLEKLLMIELAEQIQDTEFTNSPLGKTALKHVQDHMYRCKIPGLPLEHITRFAMHVPGACAGESMAAIIAYSQKLDGSKKGLKKLIDKMHIIFFQVLTFTCEERPVEKRIKGDKKTVIMPLDTKAQNVLLQELERLSGYRRIRRITFVRGVSGTKQKLSEAFLQYKENLIEIGTYTKGLTIGHSFVLFPARRPLIFDPASGLIRYENHQDAVSEIESYFQEKEKDQDPLQYVVLQIFKRAQRKT